MTMRDLLTDQAINHFIDISIIKTITVCRISQVFVEGGGAMLEAAWLCVSWVSHSQEWSATAAAVMAAASSDAPVVFYAKQVVTCVGTNGWQWQQCSLPFSFALMSWQTPGWLFSRSDDRLLLLSGTANARASTNLTAASVMSSQVFMLLWQQSLNELSIIFFCSCVLDKCQTIGSVNCIPIGHMQG